jgi:hypothetical protein
MGGRSALDQDRTKLRDVLTERLSELESSAVPKGAVVCEDIDIDVFEYDAHIVGLAKSHLAGLTVNPALALSGDEPTRKLDECDVELRALRRYTDLAREVASILLECLSGDR